MDDRFRTPDEIHRAVRTLAIWDGILKALEEHHSKPYRPKLKMIGFWPSSKPKSRTGQGADAEIIDFATWKSER